MNNDPGTMWSERTESPFRSQFGEFWLTAYRVGNGEHLALSMGTSDGRAPLVRVQSACLTGTAFNALLCDCRQQLHLSLQLVAEHGYGAVVYLAQEGRGHGLVEKVGQLNEMSNGLNTQQAALARGVEPDVRTYEVAALILRDLFGYQPLSVLTNSPTKLESFAALGIDVLERVQVEPDPEPGNREYLLVKKTYMGHLLTKV